MSVELKNPLPIGYRLESYLISAVLGFGGFGITYRARHQRLDTDAAIKEYLPQDMAVREGQTTVTPKSSRDSELYRWGLKRFLEAARTLAKFDHPNIVRVRDYLEANGTAYMVMDYEAGETLESWLAHRGTVPSEEELKAIFGPVLDGPRAARSRRGFPIPNKNRIRLR